jgi:hypothetical protein
MRDPNMDDATLALTLYDLRRERELRKARNLIGDVLDGADWETLDAVMQYGHKRNAHFRQATSYWEMCASFVNRGIFHPDIYLDTCGEGLYAFSVFKPWIARIREDGRPRFLMQTERVVNEHDACRERVEAIDKARASWAALAAEATAKQQQAKQSKKKDKKARKKRKK